MLLKLHMQFKFNYKTKMDELYWHDKNHNYTIKIHKKTTKLT
jgi:hypothetical protein